MFRLGSCAKIKERFLKKYMLIALMALIGGIMLCDASHAHAEGSLFSIHLVREDNEMVNIKLYKEVVFQAWSQKSLFVTRESILDETSVESISIRFRKFYTPELLELIDKDPKAKAQVLELEKKGLAKDEPELFIIFKDKAKAVLAKVSAKNIGRRMAFIADSKIIVAPIIREPLVDGEAVISINPANIEEMERFVARYNKWSSSKDSKSKLNKEDAPGRKPAR
jgi:hypothetical protein